MSADIGETRNLARAQPARAAKLRARLDEWLTAVGAQRNTPNSAVDAERYKQIYVDFDSSRFDPARADEQAWKAAARWRQQMDEALRRPAQ